MVSSARMIAVTSFLSLSTKSESEEQMWDSVIYLFRSAPEMNYRFDDNRLTVIAVEAWHIMAS